MSNTSTLEITLTCANCGKEGSDVTNTCNKCKSVMYCNAACKKKHRKKHKKECERRVAEIHDEKLFKQPPPLEDCPICFMRLPLESGQTYMVCCGKVLCRGCIYAVQSRAAKAGRIKEDDVCPFCRTPPPTSEGEMIKRYEKRIDLNDTEAMCDMGCYYKQGNYGLPQNYAKALELWHRAAKLGSADAYFSIGNAFKFGRGVERDEEKAVYYSELAAMSGAAQARHNLGATELSAGNMDRALRHWMIAAKDGYSGSFQNIKGMYLKGYATKDDYATALRAYQAYLDEIRSDQRDEAAAFDDAWKYYESVV